MQRPTAVTVFGILNLVFAGFGFIGVLASVMLFLPQAASLHNPMIQMIHDSPAYSAWLKFSVVLSLMACGVLLAGGIGLLMLKPWGRILSIVYAVFGIVSVPVNTVVTFFMVTQPMLQQAQHQSGPEAAGAIGGAIGGLFGSCFGLVYPVLLLIFMLRKNVVEAFRPPTDVAVGPQ